MPILHAIVLGIAQGLSEFLPISSSGHLELIPWLFGWDDLSPDLDQAFDVALHVGTFAGAAAYFRRDLVNLAGAALTSLRQRAVRTDEQRLAWLLALSAVPAAVVGASLESVIEEHTGEPWLIAVMLIVFGAVLWVADRAVGRRAVGTFALRDALLVGGAQALALQPGVSRSGVTISAARALGFDRDSAARLSFLMSLPIIFGAGLFEAVDVLGGEGIPAEIRPAFVWGTLASAVTGFAAVWLVLRVVRSRSFAPFVAYRVVLGVAVLGVVASGWR